MFKRRKAADPISVVGTRREGFFLGNSSEAEKWRLFVTKNLSRYLEFAKSDTLDAKRLSSGRIVVWLRPDATVEEGTAEPMPEKFLRGEFQGYLGGLSGTTLRRLLLSEAGLCGGGNGGGNGGDGTRIPQVTCPKPQCNDSIKDPGCR